MLPHLARLIPAYLSILTVGLPFKWGRCISPVFPAQVLPIVVLIAYRYDCLFTSPCFLLNKKYTKVGLLHAMCTIVSLASSGPVYSICSVNPFGMNRWVKPLMSEKSK